MKPQGNLFAGATHDPGGKVSLPLPVGMTGAAHFSGHNDEYRDWLERTWDESLPTLLVVMMNPSTASGLRNDPTVAKLCRYAIAWGFGRLRVANICAYRSTSPKGLLCAKDPVGPETDAWLLALASEASLIVMAYGKPPKALQRRGPLVADLLERAGHSLHVLALCDDGTPKHPLYLKGDLQPQPWKRA